MHTFHEATRIDAVLLDMAGRCTKPQHRSVTVLAAWHAKC
jgi:hypothetical protein